MKYTKIFNIGWLVIACFLCSAANITYAQEISTDGPAENQEEDPRLAVLRSLRQKQENKPKSNLDILAERKAAAQAEKSAAEIEMVPVPQEEPATDQQPAAETQNSEKVSSSQKADTAKSQEAEKEEEDPDEEGNLVVYLSKFRGTITSNTVNSFCFATVTLKNQLNVTLKEFQSVLTYEKIPVKFNVKNLAPDAEFSKDITLVGPACTKLTEAPPITIKKCLMAKMGEEACKKRVVFRPYSD